MEYTTNFSLAKPSTSDNVDISVINGNMDIIDANLGSGGASGSFIVHYTILDEEEMTLTADKTYAEILAAYNAGQIIYAEAEGLRLPIVMAQPITEYKPSIEYTATIPTISNESHYDNTITILTINHRYDAEAILDKEFAYFIFGTYELTPAE